MQSNSIDRTLCKKKGIIRMSLIGMHEKFEISYLRAIERQENGKKAKIIAESMFLVLKGRANIVAI